MHACTHESHDPRSNVHKSISVHSKCDAYSTRTLFFWRLFLGSDFPNLLGKYSSKKNKWQIKDRSYYMPDSSYIMFVVCYFTHKPWSGWSWRFLSFSFSFLFYFLFIFYFFFYKNVFIVHFPICYSSYQFVLPFSLPLPLNYLIFFLWEVLLSYVGLN